MGRASLEKDLFPHLDAAAVSPAQRQAMFYFVFAALAASVAVARRIEFPRGRYARACACIGIGLLRGSCRAHCLC